jgi:hypothetical protein
MGLWNSCAVRTPAIAILTAVLPPPNGKHDGWAAKVMVTLSIARIAQ